MSFIKTLFTKKMLLILILGFSSGLPLALCGGTLKTWLARDGVDIKTIGYFSWVGMAYSLKFFWSPLLDRFQLSPLGRRRSWMILSQVGLLGLLFWMGNLSPTADLNLLAGLAVGLAFFSATQDIAIDAFRREILEDNELGLGTSLNNYGYRVAMLVSGGLGIGLVGSDLFNLTWGQLYQFMALLCGLGILAALWAKEPSSSKAAPKSLSEAIVKPLAEFLQRPSALLVIAFVVLYKFGDAIAGALLQPFYVEMGYTNADIALIAKTYGLVSSLVGSFLGGVAVYRWGIQKSLWIFGVLQALSTLAFASLVYSGVNLFAFGAVVIFEDMSSAMATVAFVAFIASMSNRQYTATQYAALSSVATLGRNFFSGFSGTLVESLSWSGFFVACALIATPGMLSLFFLQKKMGLELDAKTAIP